jgi:hypothetical protein
MIKGRSPFRKKDPDTPEITISWKNSKRVLRRFNRAYTEYPIFTAFNENFFFNHILPTTIIPSLENSNVIINCNHLNKLIYELLIEIKKHKKQYTHFEIIRDRNFNHRKKCGLLILRFKNYPLVLKLFMETPRSFIDPYCKGFENQFFFYMSGGINRHIAGLTRIKNLELITDQIENHPRWKNSIITPRKWYWLPQKPRWIEINGRNIGESKQITTLIPSTYAIIADELDITENVHTLSSQEKSELIMQLCMDLHLFVDPHADNFVIKYRPTYNDYTISIVDTEHFPSMVGLKEEPFFNNHLEWYIYLAAKFFQDAFLQTKKSRRKAQKIFNPCAITW